MATQFLRKNYPYRTWVAKRSCIHTRQPSQMGKRSGKYSSVGADRGRGPITIGPYRDGWCRPATESTRNEMVKQPRRGRSRSARRCLIGRTCRPIRHIRSARRLSVNRRVGRSREPSQKSRSVQAFLTPPAPPCLRGARENQKRKGIPTDGVSSDAIRFLSNLIFVF